MEFNSAFKVLIISDFPGNKTAVRKKTLFMHAKTSCDLLATRSKTDTSRENNRHERILSYAFK